MLACQRTTWAQLQKDNKVVEAMSVRNKQQYLYRASNNTHKNVAVQIKGLNVWKWETFGNYPALKREHDSMALVTAATSTAAKQAILIMGFVVHKKQQQHFLSITSCKIVNKIA